MPLPRWRRALPATLATLALAVAGLTAATPSPAAAANPRTPGNITGYGFDQCLAPESWQMDRWMDRSPFLAVGIYISGKSRGCRSQPNLTPAWVKHQLRAGWRLLPITLGPQSSCHPSFPRYRDDETISPDPGNGTYPEARGQGRREAWTTVEAAERLGIVRGSTLWYDLESFDIRNTRCRESAIRFLSAWVRKVEDLGYVSGVYSSAGTGIKMLDDARVYRPGKFRLPQRIWIARWDGVANTSTSYIRDDGWRPGGRMKQYRGGHRETWGGVTINIDSNYLDLGRGSFAPRENHCDGLDVDFPRYRKLVPGTSYKWQVRALKCFLREKGHFTTGRLDGFYGRGLHDAVHRWQDSLGLPRTNHFTQRDWMRLHAQGRQLTLKTGSAGREVRRVQRALNTRNPRLSINGRYDAATRAAVVAWQRDKGLLATGIVGNQAWDALRGGVR